MKHPPILYLTLTACILLAITGSLWSQGSKDTTSSPNQNQTAPSDNNQGSDVIAPNTSYLTTAPGPPAPPIPPASAELKRSKTYYLPHYHPQITQKHFLSINYPYYLGGQNYARQQLPDLTAMPGTTPTPQEPNALEPAENMDKKGNKKSTSPPQAQVPPPAPQTTAAININTARYNLENLQDIVHKWRQYNETSRTPLEILRAQTLTRTSTNIYTINPKLAVNVKRTLGQIAQVNRHFDLTSRMAMQAILTNGPYKEYRARMDKQLADLSARLDRLTQQNDQISMALGIGKIDRIQDYPGDSKIQFNNMAVTE